MRSKHNKKRNTAFLYETLIRELTKSVIDDDFDKKKEIVETIKKHFGRGTVLHKELELYKTLLETNTLEKEKAERLLAETVKQYNNLNKERLFTEQSILISKINKKINKDALNNYVPNYKNIATIYQIFNGFGSPKNRIMLEEKILDVLVSSKKKEKEQYPISNLAFKTFVKKFNSVYSNSLLEEQQQLISRYITSFEDNGIELKLYLHEELNRMKSILDDTLNTEEIQQEEVIREDIKKVVSIMESFREKQIDEDLLEQVLKIQQLVREFTS